MNNISKIQATTLNMLNVKNVTFRQLRAFVAVAQSNSFTQASTHLHLTQSALSGLIKELEKTLAVRLFDRTTRQLSLSVVGKHLLPYAQRVLNEVTVFHNEVNSLANLEQGEVRLAVSQQFASSAFPTLIAKFSRLHPNVKIVMVDCSVEEVLEQVQSTEVDIGIGAEREHNEDISAEFIFELPFYVVLHPSNPLVNKTAIQWADLQDEQLITLQGPFTRYLLKDLSSEASEDKTISALLNPDYRVSFLSTALGMTRENLGSTLCLSYAWDWVAQYGLLMRPLVNPVVHRRFFLYRRHSRSLSPAVESFYQFLVDNLNNEIQEKSDLKYLP